jgi:hypothetical protein
MKGAEINHNELAIAEAAHSVLVHIFRLPPIDGDDSATAAPEDETRKERSWDKQIDLLQGTPHI